MIFIIANNMSNILRAADAEDWKRVLDQGVMSSDQSLAHFFVSDSDAVLGDLVEFIGLASSVICDSVNGCLMLN